MPDRSDLRLLRQPRTAVLPDHRRQQDLPHPAFVHWRYLSHAGLSFPYRAGENFDLDFSGKSEEASAMARWGIVVWFVLIAAAAAAAPTPDSARAHFEEGTKAFNLGEFTRAAEEYKAAYKLKPDPAFLYNIAQSYRLAGDLANALFFYRSFLHSTPDAPNRHEVEGRIDTLDKQLAEQKRLETTPPNTTVTPSATTAETPPPPSNGTEHLNEPQVTRPPTPLHKKWWLWTAVGGAAVAVALGVGLGVGLQPKVPDSHFGSTTVF
jgi:tetratricopeptide (TPR) repeat protein